MSKSDRKSGELSFNSIFCKDLGLQFDGVVGKNMYHKFPLHLHDSLCIGVITKGKRYMIWSDKEGFINQHEIFVINKNQIHAIEQITPHDYIAITIKGHLESREFENIIASDVCMDLFYQLFQVLINQQTDLIPEKWNKLHSHLINHHKRSDSSSLNRHFIDKSLDYIQTNYQHQIVVSDIASHVNMSKYHFCHLFKQLTGLSPHNYLRQIRLNQSYKHLQENASIFDTAIETGFYDSSHFVKTFYSYMAISPKAYQDSLTQSRQD